MSSCPRLYRWTPDGSSSTFFTRRTSRCPCAGLRPATLNHPTPIRSCRRHRLRRVPRRRVRSTRHALVPVDHVCGLLRQHIRPTLLGLACIGCRLDGRAGPSGLVLDVPIIGRSGNSVSTSSMRVGTPACPIPRGARARDLVGHRRSTTVASSRHHLCSTALGGSGWHRVEMRGRSRSSLAEPHARRCAIWLECVRHLTVDAVRRAGVVHAAPDALDRVRGQAQFASVSSVTRPWHSRPGPARSVAIRWLPGVREPLATTTPAIIAEPSTRRLRGSQSRAGGSAGVPGASRAGAGHGRSHRPSRLRNRRHRPRRQESAIGDPYVAMTRRSSIWRRDKQEAQVRGDARLAADRSSRARRGRA